MLATILYGIFIIFVIALLIGWYLFIKRLRRNNPDMSTEQLFLTAVASLFGLLFVLWHLSSSFEGIQWKGWDFGSGGGIFSSDNSEEIHKFTLKVYKPLADSLETVDTEISKMKTLLDDVDDLIDEYPRHSGMLIRAKKIWQDGSYELRKQQKKIQKKIRRAWIAHDTMNKETVDTKFSREAVKLDRRMNRELSKFRKLIIKVHGMVRKNIASSQQKIGKRKKQTNKGMPKLPKFTTRTTGKLLAFSKTIDEKIHAGMEKLIEEIAINEQRQEKNKEHLEENKDLEGPLIKVIDYWKEAEIQDRNYLDQLLYALESALLGRKLGLKKNDYAIISMNRSLKKRIPEILKRVQDRRTAIDNSY